MDSVQIKISKDNIDWDKSNLVEDLSTGMVLLSLTKQIYPSVYSEDNTIFDGVIVLNTATKEPIGTIITSLPKNKFRLYTDKIKLSN